MDDRTKKKNREHNKFRYEKDGMTYSTGNNEPKSKQKKS